MTLIDGSISSYFYIITYTKQIHTIKQANELEYFIGDIESSGLREKEYRKKRAMEG